MFASFALQAGSSHFIFVHKRNYVSTILIVIWYVVFFRQNRTDRPTVVIMVVIQPHNSHFSLPTPIIT